MKKLKFRTRIIIGFSIIFAIMLLKTMFMTLQYYKVCNNIIILYEYPFKVSNAIKDINSGFYRIYNLTIDLQQAETKEKANNCASDFIECFESIDNELIFVSKKYLGNKQDVQSVKVDYSQWKDMIKKAILLRQENKTDSLLKYQTILKNQLNKLLSHNKIISYFSEKKADAEMLKFTENNHNTLLLLFLLFIVILLVVAILAIVLSESISKPIKNFVTNAIDIITFHNKNTSINFKNEEDLLEYTLNQLNISYKDNMLKNETLKQTNEKLIALNTEYFSTNNALKTSILELEMANKKIQENEQKYLRIFDRAPVLISITDMKTGIYKEVNSFALQFAGFSKEEVIGKKSTEIGWITPENRQLLVKMLQENGKIDNLEMSFRTKNGGEVWGIVNGETIPYNNSEGLLTITTDITKRQYIEYELIKAKEEAEKNEKVVKEQSSEIETFFDCSLDLLCIANFDGYFIRLNKEWENTLGYSLDELMSRRFLDFVHPDDINGTIAEMKHLDDSINVLNFTNRYKCKDGSYKWIEWRSFPLGTKIYASARNITQQRQSEIALNEALNKVKEIAERFQLSLDISPVPIALNDDSMNITFLNRAFINTFGYTRADIPNLNEWWPRAYPDNDYRTKVINDWITEMQRSKITNTAFTPMEIVVTCKDGSQKNVLASASMQQETFEGNHVVMLYDITFRKQIEKELTIAKEQAEINEAKYRRLFDNNLSFIAEIESQTEKIICCNLAMANNIGKKVGEIEGKSMKEFLPEKTYLLRSQKLQQCIDENKIITFEDERAGMYFLNNYIPIKSGKNKSIQVVAYDITEERLAQQKITEQNLELQKLNQDKDRFMRILAHDLRSPFNTLLGFTDLLLCNIHTYDSKKIESLLYIVNNTIKSTYNLLEDLLIWSKSQSGKLPFELDTISFLDFCQQLISEIEFKAQEKDIKISVFESAPILLKVDINMFKTILRNLITNAIKFTYASGDIKIYAEKKSNIATITVSDNGVGMKPEDIEKLWNFSIPHTTEGTNKEKGTGLGLMLCKEFVEKHNGKIWVESIPSKGCDFKFTIPLNLGNNH